MSTPSPTSPPKRPRLSLQIRAIANGPTGRTSRTLAAAVDVKSPTSFNTLSNVYATAVDRSTPVQDRAPPNVLTGGRPTLRLQTQDSGSIPAPKGRGMHTPYLGPYLDTPLTAQPDSPAVATAAAAAEGVRFPSSITMTETPPMSAVEQSGSQNFESSAAATNSAAAQSARTPQTPGGARRRTTMPATMSKLPYTHPRSLHSILRNSPLPPLNTRSPVSPRRQSVRLQEKAARRVAYNSPLCQTITTSKYTKSHIDLLVDGDTTPTTPTTTASLSGDDSDVLDQTMAYTGNETRDGGQTPGPFEEMRRRMAGLNASSPAPILSPTSAGGIRKRGAKKKEKKRRWVWTIGQEDDDGEGSPVGIGIGAGATTPSPSLSSLRTSTTPVEVPRPQVGSAVVPVIALPAPRPRTRMQMARAVGAGGVPQLAIPQPATADALPSAPMPAATVRLPVPRVSATPEPMTAIRHGATPEPVTAVLAAEPPTPSLSVGSSTADPVFEFHGDVEMSDASSLYSDASEDARDEKQMALLRDEHMMVGGGGSDGDDDDEMDMDATPVATVRPAVVFQEANRGWAPWISSS